MTQPKYPAGTLLRHRASGEKVLVVDVKRRDTVTVENPHAFTVESGCGKRDTFYGENEVDLRYELASVAEKRKLDALYRCHGIPATPVSPPAWHAPGFRTDAPVKIDPKSPAIEITCRTCKQTYDWVPGEGDPFCPRCEPDYPLTATPRDA